MTDDDRDALGRVVRAAWIRWAATQDNPKPAWMVPYDELSEPDKEADRQIAEAVASDMNVRRIHLIDKKHRGGLELYERAELESLQSGVFDILEAKFPRPPIDTDRLDAIAGRLEGRTMPKPHDPHGVPAVLEGGTLDGQPHLLHIVPGHEDEAWAALRRDGIPLRRRPGGGVDHLAPGGPGYYPTDRVDAEGCPVLEWRDGPLVR